MRKSYRSYLKVMAVLDTESACALSKQEYGALIETVESRGRLNDMRQGTIYFRGFYVGVGYLKKAEIL